MRSAERIVTLFFTLAQMCEVLHYWVVFNDMREKDTYNM